MNSVAMLQFANALSDGSDEDVIRVIRAGLDFGELFMTGDYPLGMAAWAGRDAAIRELVSQGASIDQRGINGEPALTRAAAAGHDSAITLLAQLGADLRLTGPSGRTALHVACQHGYPNVVKALLNAGADCNHRAENRVTPLMDTVIAEAMNKRMGGLLQEVSRPANPEAVVDYVAVLVMLLDRGADAHAKSSNGKTALDLALELNASRSAVILRRQVTPVTTASSKQGGCYIATAVYGSYDAPEVVVLRQWRDQELAQSVMGRAFIRVYYAISPSLAKNFDQVNVLNWLARTTLDPFVCRLESRSKARLAVGRSPRH